MDQPGNDEFERRLRIASSQLTPGRLRQFACDCCRRVADLCPDPIYPRLLAFAERRAAGTHSASELEQVRAESGYVYDALYPGYGAPSAVVLALVAVGEAAFTDSALMAAITGSATAAEAVATAAGDAAGDGRYDTAHAAAFRAERQAQTELFRQLLARGQ